MTESKIELTERLRREGRWPEASRFKEATLQKLRSEGMMKNEAKEAAWKEMAEAFPPLPVAEASGDEQVEAAAVQPLEPTAQGGRWDWLDEPDGLVNWLLDAVLTELGHWQEEHAVTLADDDLAGLVRQLGEGMALSWLMGANGYWPGPPHSKHSRGAARIELAFEDASTVVDNALLQSRLRKRNRHETVAGEC